MTLNIDHAVASGDHAVVPDDLATTILTTENYRSPELYKAYRWLRQNAPIAKADIEGYDPLWLIATHKAIMEVERQPKIFTAGGGPDAKGSHNPVLMSQAEDAIVKELGGGSFRMVDTVLHVDSPEHEAMRSMTGTWFRPTSVRKLEPMIREAAQRCISSMLKPGVNSAQDFSDFCVDFPLRLIMAMLGLPEEDKGHIHELTDVVHRQDEEGVEDFAAEEVETGEDEELGEGVVGVGLADSFSYWDGIIADRRENPTNDLSTIVALARDPETGDFYPKEWAYGWLIAVVTAGHDTSVAMLGGVLEILADRPELFAELQEDFSRLPSFIEEALRWVSPVTHFVRQAVEDYELNGQTIHAGDRVLLLFQSGNRDDTVFDEPDVFDSHRSPNPHISFGYGPHQCVGRHLARQELKVMLEELLPRIVKVERSDVIGRRDIRYLPDLELTLR